MPKLRFLLITLAIAGTPDIARASLFLEDFESYTDGSLLHGQGGWKGWNSDPAAGAPVSTRFAHSGTKSVEIVSSSDLVHEFKLAGNKWAVSAQQYIPSGGTGISYFILLNRYRDGGDDGYDDWSIQTQYNLATGAITCWHDGIAGATEIVFDRWIEIKLLINLDQDTFEEFYNGQRIAAGRWDNNTHGTLQAIDDRQQRIIDLL
jgi:hypothetical protein